MNRGGWAAPPGSGCQTTQSPAPLRAYSLESLALSADAEAQNQRFVPFRSSSLRYFNKRLRRATIISRPLRE